jgi:hypothetical protein
LDEFSALEPESLASLRHDGDPPPADDSSLSSFVAADEDEERLNRCGRPAQPATPKHHTGNADKISPSPSGRFMAYPPASTVSVFRLN